jgi:hypothetical protein
MKSENDGQVALRLPQSCLERADVLLHRVGLPGIHIERADIVRAALIRGLEILETEHGVKSSRSDEPVTRTRRRR